MKKYINKIIAACTLVFLCVSCSDDSAFTTQSNVRFSAPLEASSNTVVLSPENKYQPVTAISWQGVEFPVDAPVTYALQFDVPSDTIGNTAWKHAKRVVLGEDVLSKSLLGSELNTIAKNLGLAIDVAGQIVVRAEATLDRTVYSDAIVLTVTPFVQIITSTVMYMPGDYQGWDPATAATLDAIDNGVFRGYITFPPGQLGFQFTTGPNWDQFYGADSDGNFAEGGDGYFSVPAAGSYEITVTLDTMSYEAVPYSWGIVGTATVGGWDVDTDMVYDYQEHVWSFTGPLVAGALKFRLNDMWTINYGSINNDEGIAYLDNQGAHTINEAGNYKVTFAVDPDPATATYTVTQL
jgi:hypothetical protein